MQLGIEDQAEEYSRLFEELAESINQLSVEERQHIRGVLGEYCHDFKHTLGLIISASAVIRRDVAKPSDEKRIDELLDIIEGASIRINQQFTLFVDHLANRIDFTA